VYVRALPLLAMAGVAAFVALQTQRGGAFLRLVKESRAEIRRVVWPTRKEATQTTLVVAVFVFIMALILWFVDWALSQIISLIIG
jgi:preprotein translocase subunit SecE